MKARKRTLIHVGDKVSFRLYNRPEGKFYGDVCHGVVVRRGNRGPIEREWVVNEDGREVGIWRKEIMTVERSENDKTR